VSGTIKAAGSTFQTNFQQGAISGFKSVDPNVTVDYDPVGSGTGRSDLYSNTVLFAGSDSPVPAKEASEVPAGKTILYFPVQIGPIAVAYNLSGITGLKLDSTVLAGIFQGQIERQPAQLHDHPRGPVGLLGHHRQLLPVPR
jgi:phosphate transport system substrate-binding protein